MACCVTLIWYGTRRHVRLVASLVAEPAVRLTAGVLLATALGAVGGAMVLGATILLVREGEASRTRRRPLKT